ncbi:hypothetical protein HMPREF0765_2372 [Sphingobacterium spiritivorum ATCC 33300]|uniref:Predicted membrane protein n=2 Tax=Sphingobacterium spiritivorum TaxID=258 RepID=A0A380CMQ3_SPHSI|nr:DUF2085 domain-containing protein [Sphingobacterium spiritivorum]EEI92048.1 hypothetical protein HMPREF0765_2372 [Sphingobacterium spiritivorum ATCC 33300]QQS96537.1 DUF2085 domain-containing protein [Sphingobacterium spiritivorum]SUJ24160.1 Predicted membrane protein [Sphingobacterium spiritivorum]
MKTKLEFTFCHRKPERSFFWKGKQFPVCARCTGIHLGYLSTFLFLFGVITMNFWVAVLCMLPTIIDGLTQAYCNRESNNTLRFITGIMAGVGTMAICAIIGTAIGNLILEGIKLIIKYN